MTHHSIFNHASCYTLLMLPCCLVEFKRVHIFLFTLLFSLCLSLDQGQFPVYVNCLFPGNEHVFLGKH